MSPELPTDVAFRPSDYTAALLRQLQERPELVRGARVLEVGCGSGVLLAAAGDLGAAALCGVDIEPDAVAATARLLAQEFGDRAETHQGHLFDPVRGRAFDLILANLPHFPMTTTPVDDRRPSWSAGGADGRAVVDAFLDGIDAHLAPAGRVIMAHNTFIDVEATRVAATRHGLAVRVVDVVLVPLPQTKLAAMTPQVLAREAGRSIHRYGRYAFGEVRVLELARAGVQ